ncbi:uncharacterized protein LOC132277948 [Cornus florida]|uniref:uncharacterized protein LOC132277948 n=1 Tax=Cornus florida TaxID=4283 RepID=UPI00289F7C24|nr:uncharacterized protein LOC132277948 [Cornus florida]
MVSTILDMSCFSLSYGNNWSLTSTRRSRLRISQEISIAEPGKNQHKRRVMENTMTVVEDNLIMSTPLLSALKASAAEDVASFNFPAHNRGQGAPSSLTQLIGMRPFLHDLPEPFVPEGPILDAQKQAAKLFGASQTWFLVGGTTCGIQAAIMATCSPGDTLILPRNSHISAISAMVLSGALPKYIIPGYDFDWDVAGGVTPMQAS